MAKTGRELGKKVSQKSRTSETRFTREIIYQSSKVYQTRRYDTRGTKYIS